MFEYEFYECRQKIITEKNLNQYQKLKSIYNLSTNNLNIAPTKSSSTKSVFSFSESRISDFNSNLNIPAFQIKKGKTFKYFLDIVGNVMFIYKNKSNLKYIVPLYQLYLEVFKTNNEINNSYIVTFFTTLSNNVKKISFYFQDLETIDIIQSYIASFNKFKKFDDLKYNVQQLISEGAFGKVLKAYDTVLQKDVAIKIINKKYNDTEQIQMIRNEKDISTILQETKYKGVINILDIFETKERLYIVEDYISGGNLKEYLKKYSLNENQANVIIKQLVDSIDFLHSLGIVHRDLKLENILVDISTFPIQTKIIDFGLSKVATDNEEMKEKYGTLIYLPPEIINDSMYTNKIDIWHLGIIVLTILNCGVHPFSSETQLEKLIHKIINQEFNFNKINEKYQLLLSKCLQGENMRANSKEIKQLVSTLF